MFRAIAGFLGSLSLALSSQVGQAAELYFPPAGEQWESVDPQDLGWDTGLLDVALEVAGRRQSTAVLILHRGRVLAERYWPGPASANYQRVLQGYDGAGRPVEDVASAQKSVVAVLVGMARERGFVSLDDPVTTHLGAGWSAASSQQEVQVTLRHLLSMTSGLGTDLSYQNLPGTVWLYNTPAYHKLVPVLEAATGMSRAQMTREWISEPLGMDSTAWTPRPWADPAIGVGLSTSARELARFGLMIQAGGRWQDRSIVADQDYLQQMLAPSQALNPAYGLLWWINGQEFSLGAGAGARRRDGALIAAAPADLVAMQGAGDRKLYLVPSLELVITRLGSNGSAGDQSFNDAFWAALMQAAPGR